jgi:hypothetical protein
MNTKLRLFKVKTFYSYSVISTFNGILFTRFVFPSIIKDFNWLE